MPEERRTQGRHRFGVFELDIRSGELRKHGVRVRLQEQPVCVLGMLLERPGEVVSREEIQRKLWPADTFVDFDHGLNKAINKIRDALGDSAQSPRFVETVARRGYRFLAEVRVEDAVPVPWPEATTPTELRERSNLGTGPAQPKHRRPSLTWVLSGLLLFVLIASVAGWRIHSANRSDTVIRSLAVLPFERCISRLLRRWNDRRIDFGPRPNQRIACDLTNFRYGL